MARIDVPEGPGGDAEMIWTLRPEMGAMVERMVGTVYGRSVLPAAEREVARMRIAQLNNCSACSVFRAPSVVAAGVAEDAYEHLHEYHTYAGYTERQRLAIEYAERLRSIITRSTTTSSRGCGPGSPTRRSSTSRCASPSTSASGARWRRSG